jgi:hypothetical protein
LSGYLKEANIKEDLPVVSDAIQRVTYAFARQVVSCGAIKFIQVSGLTEKGGRIRTEVRRYLPTRKSPRAYPDYIPARTFPSSARHAGPSSSAAIFARTAIGNVLTTV